MCFVEVGELLEWIVADDIGIEDEERRVAFAQDFLCEFEGTGCTEGFRLDRKLNADVVFFLVLFSK